MAKTKQTLLSWLTLAVLLSAGQQRIAAAEPMLTGAEQQQLRKLIKELDSEDPRALYLTMGALRQMGPKAAGAKDRLIQMLDDTRMLDNRARISAGTTPVNTMAVWILSGLGQPGVSGLIVAMSNKDENIRLQAVQALMSDERTVEPRHWLRAAKDSNLWVRIYGIRKLEEVKDPAAFEALCQALSDEEAEARIEAAKVLGRLANPAAIEPLLASLSDDVAKENANFLLGLTVGLSLANIGQPAIETLLKKFDSFDERMQVMANFAIQKCDPKRAKRLLHESLDNEHWQVREGALYALANLKNDEALRLVIRHKVDPNWNVRWRVAHLLGELANDKNADEIRPLLIQLAREDKETKVRDRALWTLYLFPGNPTPDYRKLIVSGMADPSPRVRATAATSANKFWDPQYAPHLLKLLGDKDANVRGEAGAALGTGKVLRAVPKLIRQLDDEQEQASQYAAYALAHIGTDQAVTALTNRVNDTQAEPKRRNIALQGLCHTENPLAKETMAAALEDKIFSGNHFLVQRELKKFED